VKISASWYELWIRESQWFYSEFFLLKNNNPLQYVLFFRETPGMGEAVARSVPLGAVAIAGVGMATKAPAVLVGRVVGVLYAWCGCHHSVHRFGLRNLEKYRVVFFFPNECGNGGVRFYFSGMWYYNLFGVNLQFCTSWLKNSRLRGKKKLKLILKVSIQKILKIQNWGLLDLWSHFENLTCKSVKVK
jgi:hypothetical protein